MKWYLVTFKDGSRVETLAPHHMSIKHADEDGKILFIRELQGDEDFQNIPEKRRYYNRNGYKSRSVAAQIRSRSDSENQKS